MTKQDRQEGGFLLKGDMKMHGEQGEHLVIGGDPAAAKRFVDEHNRLAQKYREAAQAATPLALEVTPALSVQERLIAGNADAGMGEHTSPYSGQ